MEQNHESSGTGRVAEAVAASFAMSSSVCVRRTVICRAQLPTLRQTRSARVRCGNLLGDERNGRKWRHRCLETGLDRIGDCRGAGNVVVFGFVFLDAKHRQPMLDRKIVDPFEGTEIL